MLFTTPTTPVRADVSTSAAVFVGLIGSMAGYPLLDPLAGLLVAGLIVRQVNLLCAAHCNFCTLWLLLRKVVGLLSKLTLF